MILGTAQLGLNYGINNRTGKPSKKETFKMLNYAYNNGIHMLDTASSYGDSEKLIGEYSLKSGNYFDVCTKLPTEIEEDNLSALVNRSLDKLGYDYVHTIYLHRFEQCKDKRIMDKLVELRNRNIIKEIGISIYEPEELRYILEGLSELIDVVQIPFNILDCYRWKENDLLLRACEKFTIYARSIYLQGLLLMNSQKASNDKIRNYLNWINNISEKKNISIVELAMSFVKQETCITDFIVGCENIEQLFQNIDLSKTIVEFSNKEIQEFIFHSKSIDKNIVDPRLWNFKS